MVTSHALVAMYDRMFPIGQSFMPAVNDLLLGILLYTSLAWCGEFFPCSE